MSQSQKAYRNITEAAKEIGVEPHVLRYWESRFDDLRPMTRGGGRRFYSLQDMDILRAIKQLLHVEGVPIRAARRRFEEKGTKTLVADVLMRIQPESIQNAQNDTQIMLDRLITSAQNDIAWLKAQIYQISALEHA